MNNNFLNNTYVPNNDEIKYTQNIYVSRSSLSNELAGQVIASTWLKITKYREKHFINLPLKNFSSKNVNDKFKVMLPSCVNKTSDDIFNEIIQINIKFNEIEKHNILKDIVDNIKKNILFEEIESLLKANNFDINKNKVEEYSKYENIDELTGNERIGKGMYQIFTELKNANKVPLSYSILKKWSWLLSGDEAILRTESINKTNLAPKSIEGSLNEILSFINNKNNYSVPIRVATVLCYCQSGQLFKKEINDIFSMLLVYYILNLAFPKLFEYLRYTNNLVQNHINELIKAFSDTSEENGDITYILQVILNNFYDSLKQLDSELDKVLYENEFIINNNINKNISIKNYTEDNESNKSASYYLSKYPSLSRKQAVFYINHCKKGRHYSVRDFQEFCNACQETGRYSLKKLAELKLYEEIKLNNKFLYKIKEDAKVKNDL